VRLAQWERTSSLCVAVALEEQPMVCHVRIVGIGDVWRLAFSNARSARRYALQARGQVAE